MIYGDEMNRLQQVKMLLMIETLNRDLTKSEGKIEEALKELKNYKAVTKIILDKLQSQLQEEKE